MEIRIPISIKGIVIAAEWTQKGDVAAVEIAGYDEKRYRVVNDRLGRPLLTHIKKKISVDGVLDMENDNRLLFVEQFCVEDSNESNPLMHGNTENAS